MPAPLNLIGQQFGRLMVLARQANTKHRESCWLCRCDCGIEKGIVTGKLTVGITKSCGCLRREAKFNLTGQRFGRLIVLSRSKKQYKGRQARWLCRCDCGIEKTANSVHLIAGRTKSCGCLQRELASARYRGAGGSGWKGGVTPEHKLIRHSEEYKNWRKAVFVRDNFLCQECGAGGKIQAHHIKAFAAFPDLRFEISNGQTLCVPCHRKTPTYLNRHQKII